MFKSFTHWSFSLYSTYRSCKYWARLKYIEHEPEPPPKADAPNLRGSRVHKDAELYVLSPTPVAPSQELVPFEGPLTDARDVVSFNLGTVECEKKTYFDSHWRLTTADNKWLVIVPDLKVVVPQQLNLTVDYKTGKKYGNEVKHFAQEELYNVCSWCIDPDFELYTGELWYIDQKDVVTHTFRPEQLERARARLDREVDAMMNDKIHTPSPNKVTCKYCPYSPRGTGVCAVGV